MLAEPHVEGRFEIFFQLRNRRLVAVKRQISRRADGSGVVEAEALRHGTQLGHRQSSAERENHTVKQGHVVVIVGWLSFSVGYPDQLYPSQGQISYGVQSSTVTAIARTMKPL